MNARIAVLSASWNEKIIQSAEDSFVETLKSNGFNKSQINVIKVPGSLEIPLAGKIALENGHDLAVGIGFVVEGGIYRHEFVGHTVVQSILDVQLQTGKPFLSAVLTPKAYNEDSEIYEDMYIRHMVLKGQEAAEACMRMLDIRAEIIGHERRAA